MFYYIKGGLALLERAFAVVDAGGVGYGMTISGTTYNALPHGGNAPDVTLYTYLSVREDGVELFGFASLEELSIFKLLISVSGIGPKAALSLLTFFTPEKLAVAVCLEDKKAIAKAPGIGPKTAARIVLELKDKLHASVSDVGTDTTDMMFPGVQGKNAEALDALVVLGFNRTLAAEVLSSVDTENNELEDIIRLALKKLMKN